MFPLFFSSHQNRLSLLLRFLLLFLAWIRINTRNIKIIVFRPFENRLRIPFFFEGLLRRLLIYNYTVWSWSLLGSKRYIALLLHVDKFLRDFIKSIHGCFMLIILWEGSLVSVCDYVCAFIVRFHILQLFLRLGGGGSFYLVIGGRVFA